MWIDRILELRPRERLVAIKNISLAEDHLHQHLGASGGLPALPVMPGSLIIEGMAQSAGILVGHAEGFREKVILGKVTRADLRHDAPPGYTLRYTATLQNLSPAGGSTAGRVDLLDPATGAGEHLGDIDLVFSHADQNLAGAKLPAHNFVFSESFGLLLRMSGIPGW